MSAARCLNIILNGNPRDLDAVITVQDLLNQLQLTGRLAVEINQQIVPRSLYQAHALHPGDVVEIVHAIGGG